MYQLVGYYRKHREEKPRFGLGRSKIACVVDTQLYKAGNTMPLLNLGVFNRNTTR